MSLVYFDLCVHGSLVRGGLRVPSIAGLYENGIIPTVNGQRSTVNGQRSTVNCQLSTANCQLSTESHSFLGASLRMPDGTGAKFKYSCLSSTSDDDLDV
jgi:hypothetical protein